MWGDDIRKIRLTDRCIRLHLRDGNTYCFRWHDVHRIRIFAFGEQKGVFVLDGPGEMSMWIPESTTGLRALYRRLRELPGFDHEEARRARFSEDCAIFTLWCRFPAA